MLVTKHSLRSLRTTSQTSKALIKAVNDFTADKKRVFIRKDGIKQAHYEVQPMELEYFKIKIQGL